MHDGQGVEVGAVGEFTTRWHLEAGADAADVWHLDPGGCVGDGLEVEGQSGFPRVDGAACFCDGGPLGYVVEDDWGGGGGGGGGGGHGDDDGVMGRIGKRLFIRRCLNGLMRDDGLFASMSPHGATAGEGKT